MRGKHAGGLDAEAGGHAGDQDALAGKVDAGEHLVGGGLRPELCGHVFSGFQEAAARS